MPMKLKKLTDLHKLGLRLDPGDPTKAVPLAGPNVSPALRTGSDGGTVPCPVCGRQICSCLLQDREYLARVVGRRMRGEAGGPATAKGGRSFKRPFPGGPKSDEYYTARLWLRATPTTPAGRHHHLGRGVGYGAAG